MEIALLGVIGLLLAVALFLILKMRKSEQMVSKVTENSENLTRLTEGLLNQHIQMEGQLKQMSADGATTRAEINKTLAERLDNVSKRLGDSLAQSTEKTGKSLTDLQARLAIIDKAQDNLTDLSNQVVGLQDILANKQARGAFGEIQLNDLVKSALPPSAYEFQVTLTNGKRADCLIKLPNPPGSIVVDAKFPLESYHLLQKPETDGQKPAPPRAFTIAIHAHIADISAKYIVDDETAESALLFLPSEAVYAELHANFPAILEKSYQARVWIVSPTTLMATLNTVRAVLKDSQMREQAGVIQKEVGILLKDISRLEGRVDNLGRHFAQANKDIQEIETSSRKITSRAEKIEDLQLGESDTDNILESALDTPKELDQQA
jgi:DNA recombination protein RmuC